jgi:hypothetical protein
VHLDNGWNSEIAVSNIANCLDNLEIDLYTHVLDWEEFKDLQLAFLRASTPDSEIPTDHAIVALLYQIASRENVKYIVIGSNYSTEAIGVRSWSQGHADWRYIKNIYKRFGTKKLSNYPYYDIWRFIYYRFIKKIQMIRLLDYVNYIKKDAVEILVNELDWKPYGGKHGESRYTRFFQAYILPKKFGFDKRRPHLSSLICSGQISRNEALEIINQHPYTEEEIFRDREYIAKKFDMRTDQFDEIMNLPLKKFSDYPSYKNHPLFKTRLIKEVYYKIR